MKNGKKVEAVEKNPEAQNGAEQQGLYPEVMSDNPDVMRKATAILEQSVMHYSGPLPHPDLLRQFGEIVPNGPERIFKVFEAESEHAREMQKLSLQADVERDRRAQWMSFAIMLTSLGVVAFAIYCGSTIVAGIAGIFSALAVLFLALRVLFPKRKINDPKPDAES